MKLAIIIQARTSSTRLPGKVLLPFFEEKSILQLQIEALQNTFSETKLVVATSVNHADDKIEQLCESLHISCFRGSETDVLERFVKCANWVKAEVVIRVCSDNPFLLGSHVKTLVSKFNNQDYLSFKSAENVPAIKMHWGLFAEIVKVEALERALKLTQDPFYHEHVTNYIYGHPTRFNVQFIEAPKEVFSRNDLRFTIDTEVDFKLAQQIYPRWNKATLKNLLAVTEENSENLTAMKQGIDQFSK